MNRLELLVMYFCTGLTLCVLYATQPIGPVFEVELGISRTEATLFTTSMMTPLAFASIFYGYILERVAIKKLLILAFLLLGVSEIIFSLSSSYFWMLNIRGFQGLLVPAVLTGIMSYISTASTKENVASAIGAYIGVTIIGGFLGRFFSGFFTDLFGWRVFFIMVGILLLLAAFLVFKFSSSISASFIKPKLKDIIHILKIKHNLYIYMMIFGIFFSFQAILNFIPFELTNLGNEYSGSKTGMMYFGYVLGVLISFNLKKIVAVFRTAQNAIIFGIIVFLIALQIFRFESFLVMFVAMLVFCIGNFIAHSVASGFINKMAESHKGISNGLYVSFYYAGGALGSFLPGFIYMQSGWGAFLTLITAISSLSLVMILVLKYAKQSV
ncbi:major facilitator superfamily transporter [Campylobacter iguaniorum]|uniref:Major facilitator superfamily transporter n=1 Tax=Campylobacter iguaniorum TaxID=1244531 RepID=A0A076F9W9_9BACT|nr:MFS transporter [Campylobacter iguaniorum]AII14493.1 major facilitator superfamily transporter [Campylobacter iguaniorum]ALV24228.1 major facilitator superfamily transporter [Campylobacter iguaniorum]